LHAARAAAAAPSNIIAPEPPRSPTATGLVLGRTYTQADLTKHNTPEDCWIAIEGVIYDTNPYLAEHPGGALSITMNAGTDATDEFTAIHSKRAWALLEKFAIGSLAQEPGVVTATDEGNTANTAVLVDAAGRPTTLRAKRRVGLELLTRTRLSGDAFRLRFSLPSPKHILGLPVGKHALVYGVDGAGKMVARAYTPVTGDEVAGYVDLVVKAYRPSPPRFPKGGALSQYLCDVVPLGAHVDFRGPLGEIEYVGCGVFEHADRQGVLRRFVARRCGLLAGGTGLTPMLQLINAVANERERGDANTPSLALLLGNRTEADILCRDELEHANADGHVTLHLTLDRPPAGWSHFSGFVDAPMLAATMPKASDDTFIFCCGPPPMIKAAIATLENAGHEPSHILCF
jgi:nitrate reductase (NAD(P)H)